MANVLEGGATPDLSHDELREIGYAIAAYPLTLMAAAMRAMTSVLSALRRDEDRNAELMTFAELRRRIGFDAYYEASAPYETSRRNAD